MKKMIFALTVLMLVAPAWATNVTITAKQVGDTNEVEIWYETDGSLPRAFGLNIILTGGTVEGCSAEFAGQCDAQGQGFGIFPGTIDINDDTGEVDSNGTPVAPNDAPGAEGTGLGTGVIVVELGSLYHDPLDNDANAPDPCGVLCTIIVSDDTTHVDVNGNAARTGTASPEGVGVVLEDPCEAPPTVTFVDTVVDIVTDCLIGGVVNPLEYSDWVAWGKPDCWCYEYQCRGDINGRKTMLWRLQALDLEIFRAAFFQMDPQLANVEVAGVPGICADLNHFKTMLWRVAALDLIIFRQFFFVMDPGVPPCDQAPVITGPYNFWTTP